jgi:hypothetical protein
MRSSLRSNGNGWIIWKVTPKKPETCNSYKKNGIDGMPKKQGERKREEWFFVQAYVQP